MSVDAAESESRLITPPWRHPDELRDLARCAERDLEGATPYEAAQWAAVTFGRSMAVASSMTDTVLPHMMSAYAPGVDVLFVDTGYHFAETIDTRDLAEMSMNIRIVDVRADDSVADHERAMGAQPYRTNPNECCARRKVGPLGKTLRNYQAWVTGLRRDESEERADTPVVQWDNKFGLVKINPLAFWSADEAADYAEEHAVVVNPLLAEGYPSIGCEPCTAPVGAGENERAGRWVGLAKTECGLHL